MLHFNFISNTKLTGVLCICLFMLGCSGQSELESATQDYAERISRVINIDIDIGQPAISLSYPEAPERVLTIPDKTLKLSEFYAINNCPLAPLIAQRNTALGKVETPSRRYVYELNVLNALAICAEQVDESESRIQQKLTDLTSHKTSQISMVRAKLLQDSEAIRLGTGFSRAFLAPNDSKISQGFTETLLALEFLSSLANATSVSYEELETHLESLEKYRLLAVMWRTQQYISNTLPAITTALDQYATEMNCSVQTTDKTKILDNILNMFFVNKIQAIGGQLNAYHYQFKPLIEELLNEPFLASSVKTYWHTQTHDEFTKYQNTIKQHVQAWQNIREQCS